MYRIHSGTPFGRPLRYRIEAMKMNAGRIRRWQAVKKYTACGRFVGASHVEAR